MSETTTRVDAPAEVATEVPGIAARCQAIRAVLARGPATWGELRDGLRATLNIPEGEVLPIGDDLATLQVGGWVEAVPGEPETFRLVADSS